MTPEEQLQLAIALLEKTSNLSVKQIKKLLEDKKAVDEYEADDLYEDGKKAALDKERKALIKKAKALGVEDDLSKASLSEIFEKVVEAKVAAEGEGSEDVEALKVAHKKAIDDLKKAHLEEIEQTKKSVEGESAKIRREAIAREILVKNGFKIPEDEAAAKRKFNMVLRELESGNYVFDEKTGEYVKADEHGDPIKEKGKVTPFSQIAEDVFTSLYDRDPVKKKDGAGGSGSGKDDEGKKGGVTEFEFKLFKGEAPTDKASYLKLLVDPNLKFEEKTEIKEYWTAKQAEEAAA